MLLWNELHPYNAVHAVQLRGPLDATRVRAAVNTTVAQCGLTRLTLDSEQFTFQYEGGPADCEIPTLAGAGGFQGAPVAEMERQLNAPFDHRRPFCPFRFFAMPAGDTFYLGLGYFHPVADAESVVALLKDIVTAYRVNGRKAVKGSLELYPDHRAHLLRRHPRAVAHKLLSLPVQVRRLRQSYRARYRDADNMTNGFACFSLAPEDLRALVAAARAWAVTVNDLFLALLMKSVSPWAAARAEARRRRKLSLGCIVNLRKDLGMDSRRAFGLFLGSFTVTHEAPAGMTLRRLAGDLSQQTGLVKRHRLYLGTPLELGLGRFLFRFFSPERRKRLYAKHYPLWGGITNMNLNQLWDQGEPDTPLDYFRGVSTGPLTPLVLSATTFSDRLNLGLSYRTAVFSPGDIESLQGRFREHLAETRSAA